MPYCAQCGNEVDEGTTYCSNCGARQGVDAPDIRGGSARTAHIKSRNMWMQVVLVIITLGIYTIYWCYVTLKEIHIANGSSDGPGLWTVLYVIPFVNFLAYWHYSDQYAKFTGQGEPFLYTLVFFILWIVFSPAVWFFVQRDLNSVAGGPA